MALDDMPQFDIWEPHLPVEVLQGIGALATLASHVEQEMHLIYWRYSGLSQITGPAVTSDMTTKRLGEGINKFAKAHPSKRHIFSDLKLLIVEAESLLTQRNHCVHWVWESAEYNPLMGPLSATSTAFVVKKPLYKYSSTDPETYDAEKIKSLCHQMLWLSRRLWSHATEEDTVRKMRKFYGEESIEGRASTADIFFPAPWLDKQTPPEK